MTRVEGVRATVTLREREASEDTAHRGWYTEDVHNWVILDSGVLTFIDSFANRRWFSPSAWSEVWEIAEDRPPE